MICRTRVMLIHLYIHTSQSVPEYPTGQMHLNFAIISTHSPPFLHGAPAHSSMSVSQSLPVSSFMVKREEMKTQKRKTKKIRFNKRKPCIELIIQYH